MIEAGIKLPDLGKPWTEATEVLGWETYRWPEFIAFAKRLGIPLDVPTKRIVIDMQDDGLVKVYLEMLAGGGELKHPNFKPKKAEPAADEPLETTSLHNEKFKTFAPPRERP